MRQWIWSSSDGDKINTRSCFSAEFAASAIRENTVLHICAVSRYRVWLNGTDIGAGPVRAAKGVRCFDEYDISAFVQDAAGKEMLLAVEVWNFGLSNYQNIAEHPGLCFWITQGHEIILESGESTLSAENTGYLSDMPKRNVNLGFSDYFDGRRFPSDWYRRREFCRRFTKSVIVPDKITADWTLCNRKIRTMTMEKRYPSRVEAVQDIKEGCHVVTINLRNTLFPGRRDANETTMAAVLGTVLYVPREMEGEISFPNRTWNGIIGSFSIAGKWYPVSDKTRNHIRIHLSKGSQLFLLFACGTFDDLYCHIEISLPDNFCPTMSNPEDSASQFFVVGPLCYYENHPDGIKKDHPDSLTLEDMENDLIWKGLKNCRNPEDAEKLCKDRMLSVPAKDIYMDAYILSLARNQKVVADYAVGEENLGILWNNTLCTEIGIPRAGEERRIILDFGTLLAGRLSVTLEAPADVVIDFYAYENDFEREPDFTIGLNNGARYITRDGWQTFTGMARMGIRFLMICFHHSSGPIRIQDLHVDLEHYSVTNAGKFECSDALLNRIFEMCRETNLLCTEDSFTDCPTYEQAFWIGDACISSKVNTMLYGDTVYQMHNEELACAALNNTPIMNALTPTDWNTSIPMWAFDWIQSVFDTAEQAGNEACVETFYPKLSEVLRNYAAFVSPSLGFYIHADSLIDWAPMDVPREGCITAQEGMLAWCYQKTAEYASHTGREEDASFFSSKAEILKNHLENTLWDSNRKAYADCWTKEKGLSHTFSVQTQLLLCYTDMVPENKRYLLDGYLTDPPEDFVRIGSPFMLFYLYETCMRRGMKNFVIEDIKRRWEKMLYYDSTTCWEVFPGFYENSRTRSYCHSWSSSPAYFLLRYMTGLELLKPDYSEIAVGRLPENLTWCRAEIPTRFGRIRIDWHREDKKRGGKVILILPEGIHYRVDMQDPENEVQIRLRKAMK